MSEGIAVPRKGKSVQEVSTHHGRTDVRYWQPKVFNPWYTHDGQRREVEQYAVKVQYRGRRENVNLGTPNRTAAAGRARDFYVALVRSGWEAALAAVKAGVADGTREQATVGEFLEELEARAELRPKTFEGYAVAFRKIVGDIFAIQSGRERYDYKAVQKDARYYEAKVLQILFLYTYRGLVVAPSFRRVCRRDYLRG